MTTASQNGARPNDPSASPVVRVHAVSHAYGRRWAIRDINLEVAESEFIAIVGPSGCGKTTLLNLLAGLESPRRGTLDIFGSTPRTGRTDVGYLFARDSLLPWRTVLGNAELAMEMFGWDRATRQDKARQMLEAVGLSDYERAYPAQLSQGMRQRVAIARTLAPDPRIVFLDEPFSALDAQTKLLLQDTFRRIWESLGSTVILITHDLAEAIAMADRVVLFTRGPGRIKNVYVVDLPAKRSLLSLQGEQAFHSMYEQIWADLRDEVASEGETADGSAK